MKLDPRQLEAVAMLEGNREFGVFMQAVADNCAGETQRLIVAPEGNEYLRGQVFAYSELLDAVATSRKKLERAKQPKT